MVAAATIGAIALVPVTSAHDRSSLASLHRSPAVSRSAGYVKESPYTSQATGRQNTAPYPKDVWSGIGSAINAVTYTGVNSVTPICSLRPYCTVPVGLADEGARPISTSAFMGNANVTQLNAQSFTQTVGGAEGAPPSGALNGAALQLNAFLAVSTNSGTGYYWIQNFAEFLSSNSDFIVGSEIWNSSMPGTAGANATFTSPQCNGSSSVTLTSGGGCEYGPTSYSLPLGVSLLTSVQTTGNQAVISFGYYLGAPSANLGVEPTEVQYAQIAISVPGGINSAAFVAQPGGQVDTANLGVEFAWGGYGNALGAHFSQMNSEMNLYEEGRGICCFKQEPQAWRQVVATQDYAVSTAEATDNLAVAPASSGQGISVSAGTPNPGQMEFDYLPQPLLRRDGR